MLRLHRWGRLCFALLSCCFLIGCGAGNGANSTLFSGVQGQVTRGPITPVSQQGQINEAPFPGVTIVVQRQNGAEVARQISDSHGNYKIGAAPGEYQVVGLAPNGNSGPPTPPAPQAVTVRTDQYATINVSYDTGIR